ncbi:Protein IQ-DOMAIN [Trichinella spiralis]|uniref:Protein IQ-DOMAIN n=1 Tax=Trichinella spiralis TaxID=6334 RepID=A0ABR3K9W0_TRISP
MRPSLNILRGLTKQSLTSNSQRQNGAVSDRSATTAFLHYQTELKAAKDKLNQLVHSLTKRCKMMDREDVLASSATTNSRRIRSSIGHLFPSSSTSQHP